MNLENLSFSSISTSSTSNCATHSFSAIYLPTLLSSVTEGLGIPGPHNIETFFGSQRLCPLGSLFRTHYASVWRGHNPTCQSQLGLWSSIHKDNR